MDADAIAAAGRATPTTAGRSASHGPTDDDITRALDRLTKARIRLRDVTDRLPVPQCGRIEAIERAHRAVEQAERVMARRPDDQEISKTHALAEIAEVMALRRDGFVTRAAYEQAVAPVVSDPELIEALRRADQELADAQTMWDTVKGELIDPATNGPIIDLTASEPVIEPR